MKSAIAVLCGGKSRRMGQDKAFLNWKGQTMLDHMVGEMSGDGREILISASKEISALIGTRYSAEVVADEWFDHGPLEGLRCVLKRAQADSVFFCAVDMPFMTLSAVRHLEQEMEKPEYQDCDCLVFKEGSQRHPLCGIYRKSALPVLEKQLEEKCYRVMVFLESLNGRTFQIEESGLDPRILCNINTLEDYEQIQMKQ